MPAMSEFLAPALAFGLAFFLTPYIIRLAHKTGALDQPEARKIHREPTPLLGGLAVFFAFWVTVALVLLFTGAERQLMGLFAGSSVILLLGFLDDLKGLSYKIKFGGQFAAALILIAYNIRIEFITLPFGDMIFLGPWIAVPLTLLWVVGVTNAVNLIDGIDGLATGVSAIAAVVMFSLMWGEFPVLAVLSLVLAGAALGFLPHNFNPARIFLGDTGSLFLGFMLAAFSITGVTKQATLTTVAIPLLIFGLPITDTFYAIWRRFRSRQPLFKADNGHIHHRLLDLGLSTRQAVLVLYCGSIYFGLSAILFNRFAGYAAYLIPFIFLFFFLAMKRLDSLSGAMGLVGNGGQKRSRSEGS